MQNQTIRLHLPAIPYTITRDEYSHDAFTGKVKRFSPMMRSLNFEVYHYGVETSESGATKDIQLFTKSEWTTLRIQTLMWLENNLTLEEATQKNNDPKLMPNHFSNWNSPLTVEFNKRLALSLKENYRSKQTDIICIPLARTYEAAIKDLNAVSIETGIGYSGSYLDFRIFESHSWLSHTLGSEKKEPHNYWFVIPNYFDIHEFKLSLNPSPLKVGFLGRLGTGKGCNIIVEIAKRFPNVEFILCGAGDPLPFLSQSNIIYKSPIHGDERSEYLGSCIAVLCPSKYLEPFCGVAVEAQLCGTPVICSDWGALTETVEQFKTGLRCHTLADYCKGIQMAIDNKFDRKYIRERAANLYDMYKLAHNYEYVFNSVLDIFKPEKNGWYSPDSHIFDIKENDINTVVTRGNPHIYIFVVYYGELPNYFQLYLDSLEINTDILTVFLVSDINISSYKVPKNLIQINMQLQIVKHRAKELILQTYNVTIDPEQLITTMYKLVDFKIVYPLLFDDILKQYNVTEADYVGWGDCDLIYGKLSNFIKFTEEFEIIGGWHGHLTAIKNTTSFKNNFKTIPNYLELITDNSKTHITDEIAYREHLIAYLEKNKFKMFYTNRYFCDVVPECFFHMFRHDYQNRSKNFFDTYNADKNISYLYFDNNNKTLSVKYEEEQNQKEVLYCHLQKRKMEQKFTSYKNGYYINIDSFTTNEVVQKALLTKNYIFTEKKHITVVTYCSGYHYEVFFKFAATLYDTGFSGNLIFVIQEKDKINLNKLTKTFPNVSYYVDDVVNSRHCQEKRYYIFQKMFTTLNLTTDYVLLCDSRDILFQLNIEDYPLDTVADLFFFEEGKTINECQINKDWLKAIEDELEIDIISKIKNNNIICSGTTYGKYSAIKNYVDRMCNIMSNKVHTMYTKTTGFDQGIHNYLIYIEGFADLNIKFMNNEDRLVNTLQYANHKFMNAQSQLVNKKNEPSYIVHQYDRLPDYMTDRLFLKYKSKVGGQIIIQEIKKRIAVLFYGRISFYKEHYKYFINNLGQDIDFFLSHSPDLNENIADFQQLYNPISVIDEIIDDDDIYKKYLENYYINNPDKKGILAPSNTQNMRKHFINKKRVINLLKSHIEKTGAKYDFICVTRIDMSLETAIDWNLFENNNNTIYIPEGDDYGGLNDRLCIGDVNSVEKYCSIFTNSLKLLENGTPPFPEIILTAHVKDIGLEVKRFPLIAYIRRLIIHKQPTASDLILNKNIYKDNTIYNSRTNSV